MSDKAAAHEVTYSRAFYEAQSPASLLAARRVVPAVEALVSPRSVVDVGCGVGTWLSVFRERGVAEILGIDGSYVDPATLLIPAECFLPRDLTGPINVSRRFDMAISLEVAEHLPPSSSGSFVDQITGLSDIVLFSAAIPGQGGANHINEQWQSYWRRLFDERGYAAVDCLRYRFWDDAEVQAYYRQNMLLYVDRELLAHCPHLQAEAERGALIPSDLVHPLLLEFVRAHPPKLSKLIGALPGAIRQSVNWHLGRGR
jgi:SAM-dependent methyltransferase